MSGCGVLNFQLGLNHDTHICTFIDDDFSYGVRGQNCIIVLGNQLILS